MGNPWVQLLQTIIIKEYSKACFIIHSLCITNLNLKGLLMELVHGDNMLYTSDYTENLLLHWSYVERSLKVQMEVIIASNNDIGDRLISQTLHLLRQS